MGDPGAVGASAGAGSDGGWHLWGRSLSAVSTIHPIASSALERAYAEFSAVGRGDDTHV
jgi:hypothetical protein